MRRGYLWGKPEYTMTARIFGSPSKLLLKVLGVSLT
jgi:hypothetical protein